MWSSSPVMTIANKAVGLECTRPLMLLDAAGAFKMLAVAGVERSESFDILVSYIAG